MDDVYCYGNESKISECKFTGWGNHDCRKNELVGVQCFKLPQPQTKPKWNPFDIRLPKESLLKFRKV